MTPAVAARFAGFAAHAADRQRPGAQRAAAVSRANNNFYSMRREDEYLEKRSIHEKALGVIY